MRSLVRCCAVLVTAFFMHAPPLAAQAARDSTRKPPPFFTWRDAAILEAFAIATVAAAPLDRRFAERLQNPNLQRNRNLRNIAVAVEQITDPGSFIIGGGMYVYGRLRDNQRAADLGLHGTEALFIGAQVASVIKGIAGRARPYMNSADPHNYEAGRGFGETDFRSFPSGHATSAFAAAAAVTSETKRWWPRSVWLVGPVMYGGAAAVAWSRMFDNKHWASDVLAGAAIGTFTGLKVVHFHHYTRPDNWLDERLLSLRAFPTPDGRTLVGMNVAF
jgi:membrane-associated phospholipid phosphatase